jgi:hypothetical protein
MSANKTVAILSSLNADIYRTRRVAQAECRAKEAFLSTESLASLELQILHLLQAINIERSLVLIECDNPPLTPVFSLLKELSSLT